MHIAHFIQRYPPALGGSEAYFARLGQYLEERGDRVTVWTTTAIELEELWKKPLSPRTAVRGRAIRRYTPMHFPARRYLLKALSLVPIRPWQCMTMPCNPICPAMWRDAGRYDGPLDAVHAAAFPYAFPILCGLQLARRRGVPFFLTPFLHLGDPANSRDQTRRQYLSPQLRWLLRQADCVFVQTQEEYDVVSREAESAEPSARVILQGLGVDPEECTGGDREGTRMSWGTCGEPVIGHLANASAEKGTIDLLLAAERAWAAGHRFRVVLAGPEMPAFQEFWKHFICRVDPSRVTRLGVLSDEAKRDFFAAIDAFALPSRSDSFGLVLLEAWANGKPNLVYRAGGPGELVRHGIDGLQAACGNVEELALQLSRLVGDANLRERLGANGQERVAREFVWDDKLALVRNEMFSILASGGRKPPDSSNSNAIKNQGAYAPRSPSAI
ncbi:MAG TPA: glycosyltransferase family 4 protein [Gemmataceae bacterium]|jgi:glycosyltransferase involved in cell wall biosynthesis